MNAPTPKPLDTVQAYSPPSVLDQAIEATRPDYSQWTEPYERAILDIRQEIIAALKIASDLERIADVVVGEDQRARSAALGIAPVTQLGRGDRSR